MGEPDVIHAAFQLNAQLRPAATALASDVVAISYGELDMLSRQLAEELTRASPSIGGVVAILAERRAEIVVAMLACTRAGRPFVVLDLAYPPSRLRALIEICRPEVLLLAGGENVVRSLDLEQPSLTVSLEAAPFSKDEGGSAALISPDDPAYLLFTSGSTGTPKCVACSHRPLVNFIAWQERTFGLGPNDRFTLLSGLSHDPLLRDVFTPLSVGASIHIPSQATLTAPGALHAWFAETQPTVAHITPPLGHLLTAVRPVAPDFPDLRYVFWGGDVLRTALVDAVARFAPNCESVNFYGSTETPQAACFFRAPAGFGEARVPIGVGVDGFELQIRDDAGRLAPDGEAGEIIVRSPFLTLGYVENGQLPNASAVAPAYATGDIGLRGRDGQVRIQGRRDDQVKVRGYRVEMAEITALALRAPQVGQAITLNIGTADAVRLCCFVQPERAGEPVDVEALRGHLTANLPSYMVPDELAAIEALPLLPNGKVDRQALLLKARAAVQPAARSETSLTETERELLRTWRDLFGANRVTRQTSFASLGGDSLSYVNAYLSAEKVLGGVPDGWITMSVAELAARRPPDAKRSAWVAVESAILMRAVAITGVVASHFGLLFSGGAATSALIWFPATFSADFSCTR